MIRRSDFRRILPYTVYKYFKQQNIVAEYLKTFTQRRMIMWTKPAAADLRFGFEVTMYIAAR
jgi:coenzyme PQQ precursor peptide PqqA